MWLDLKDIIEMPGKSKAFETVLQPEALQMSYISRFTAPLRAVGTVENTAGLLNLRAEMPVAAVCVCDRCGSEFAAERMFRLTLPLAPDPEDGDDGELYPLEGDGVDVDKAIAASFLLDAEMKCLCRPDCRGLCSVCGKNLNDGPCGCQEAKDPRFAVLEQLLDNESSPDQR